jgi:hypothetical protein
MAAENRSSAQSTPFPPSGGSPRPGVARSALSPVHVAAASLRGVSSKPRAAAFFRKLRSASARIFAAYSSVPCLT